MSAKHKNSQSSYTWKELKPDDLNTYIRDSLVMLWLMYLSFSSVSCVFPSLEIGEKKYRATLNTKVGRNK